MKRLKLSELPAVVRSRAEATEHNLEDLLLCMNSMRPKDVLSMHWNWEEAEWQPALIDEDEHYPQCFATEGEYSTELDHDEPPLDYQILWSVPLCGRDQSKHWHDIRGFRTGYVRQALIFDYDISASRQVDEERLTIWFGSTESIPLVKIYASDDNRIVVDADLLIALSQEIDDLNEYLALEKRALEVLHLRENRHAEMDVHTNE
jgi:hypothetical protein